MTRDPLHQLCPSLQCDGCEKGTNRHKKDGYPQRGPSLSRGLRRGRQDRHAPAGRGDERRLRHEGLGRAVRASNREKIHLGVERRPARVERNKRG